MAGGSIESGSAWFRFNRIRKCVYCYNLVSMKVELFFRDIALMAFRPIRIRPKNVKQMHGLTIQWHKAKRMAN